MSQLIATTAMTSKPAGLIMKESAAAKAAIIAHNGDSVLTLRTAAAAATAATPAKETVYHSPIIDCTEQCR